MEAAGADLRHIGHDYNQMPVEVAELEVAHGHVHEAEVAAKGLSLITRVRHWAQLQVIENAPSIGTFIEAQAACSCGAGCAKCGGGTFLLAAWHAAKDWVGGRFSHSGREED